MRKRLILAATVLLALFGLGAVPATAAATAAHHTVTSAAPASDPRNCPDGDVCIFSAANFGGSFKNIAVAKVACFDTFPFAPASVKNGTNTTPATKPFDVTFFTNTNCTGTALITVEEFPGQAPSMPSNANSFLSAAS